MSKIELSYHLGPENSAPNAIDLTKPRQQALLRNALMDLLQAVREQGSIGAAAQADLTITVTGAAVGDEVVMALPAAPAAGLIFNAFVSAANTVTIRASNISVSPVDAGAATYGVIVIAA